MLKQLNPIFRCFIICYFFVLTTCDKTDDNQGNNTVDLMERLEALEGIDVVELDPVDHFQRLFRLTIEQPVDHNNPNGATFFQKLYLGHVDENLPLVFETEGYSRQNHKTRELSGLLGLNQLTVEHRYNGESKPNVIDWQYLTIWQAANDHHRIVEIFKQIYGVKWVSSGVSKGGDTAIFHRRFFPSDVDATVAYVAPILFEERDTRFLDFYEITGTPECRDKLKAYQRNMLLNIDDFPPLFEDYVNFVNSNYNTNFTFSIPYQDIVYHSIREDYWFEFWSSESESCETIPEEDATLQELFDHYVAVFDIFLFFSDYGADFWTPWYYQSLTEIGNYAYDASHLTDLEMDFDPLVEFEISTTFNSGAMQDINNWFSASAEHMILIYGEQDPWTVGAFEDPMSQDVLHIINPGTKHSTRIENLSLSDQALVMDRLNLWLDL